MRQHSYFIPRTIEVLQVEERAARRQVRDAIAGESKDAERRGQMRQGREGPGLEVERVVLRLIALMFIKGELWAF